MSEGKYKVDKGQRSNKTMLKSSAACSATGGDDDDIQIVEVVNKPSTSKNAKRNLKKVKSKVENPREIILEKELKIAKQTIHEQETQLKELLDKIEDYETQVTENEAIMIEQQVELDEAEEKRMNSVKVERKGRLAAEKKGRKLEELVKCINVELTSVIQDLQGEGSDNDKSDDFTSLDDIQSKLELSFASMQTKLAKLTTTQKENKDGLVKTKETLNKILVDLDAFGKPKPKPTVKKEPEVVPKVAVVHKILKRNLCHCGRKFKTKTDLTRHIYRLKLGKHFLCKLCGVGFKGNWELKDHYKRIHKLKHSVIGIGCAKCGHTFQTRKALSIHQKTVHKLVTVTRDYSIFNTCFIYVNRNLFCFLQWRRWLIF